MPAGEKEAMSSQNFDEDEYKSNLVDNENYSEESAKMLAAKKKEQLAEAATKAPVTKFEIDLNELLEKAKTKKKILVRRAGKTFYREQEVGSDKDKSQKKLKTGMASLMDESVNFESRRSFMSAVNKAWKDGEMVEVGSERGVKFGDMLLTENILGNISSAKTPYSKLLQYKGKD